METNFTICKNFGRVSCGKKAVHTVAIENTTKKAQVLKIERRKKDPLEQYDRLRIHPVQIVAQPKQAARFTLTYLSSVEDITDNFCYIVLDSEKLVARLKVHAYSVGPCLHPRTFNVKFFHFRNMTQIVQHLEITNTTKCEAKYYFDLDEDYEQFEISQRSGIIPAGLKLGLKLTFKPSELGVYFRKIFCIVQFHEPIIFNILGVYQPKLKIEPKDITFKYPFETFGLTGYEAYMSKAKKINLPEGDKIPKCIEESKTSLSDESEVEEPCVEETKSATLQKTLESKYWSKELTTQIFLTNTYIDIKNSAEVLRATILVNTSRKFVYYYEWDHDPRNHFQIEPCKGCIEPNAKTAFTIYFTPSIMDNLYHFEADIKIFPCSSSSEAFVYLPLTMSLKIIGNSFCNDNCGWIAQCTITPKVLHLRSCVPDETVYGTFMIERQGHLPFNYVVVPPKDPNLIVQPPLGYLSKDFQLLVVQFRSESKRPGNYTEDLKIKFNNSESNFETIKIITSVETPTLILGENNSVTFPPVFPGSRTVTKILMENPTNLHLSYEFKIPEDITWTEIISSTGLIEPKSFEEVEVIFKPDTPCEYLDYIPCYVSSTSKMDCTQIVQLQLIGSCQYGYLVATPSIHDFGECVYKERRTVKIHLFNFSPITVFFKLTAHGTFGDPQRDVKICPSAGLMPPKGNLKIKVTVTPHEIDTLNYEIKCQNFENDSEGATPCEDPIKIFSLRFEGVLATLQIIDVNLENGGPLFSPHWLWKMLCIESINEGLKSLEPQKEINITLPEAQIESPPMSVSLLLEASQHGEINWDASVEIISPCVEPSENSLRDSTECLQEKLVTVSPHCRKLCPKQRLISTITFKYTLCGESIVLITLRLPYERKLILKTVLTTLPEEGPLNASVYLNSTFNLKPVFIGDDQPPLQLFWLYNNTPRPASYFLDRAALKEATTMKGIFDCINPTGDIPPFSSTPLGFVFSPNEIMSYSAEVVLGHNEQKPKHIRLSGEGFLNLQQSQEIIIEKTIPKVRELKTENCALECHENIINIPFFLVYSQIKRLFFIKNTSKTKEFAFNWHKFNAENIFTAIVEPEKGVIKPAQEILMILSMQSYSHHTFVSFSIPCDVISYSELKAYETSVRTRDKLAEKSKDYFTITEKGILHETQEYPISKKPEPCHLFLTINANIVNSLNIDRKLTPSQQSIMKAESEISNHSKAEFTLKPSTLPSFQGHLEKLLWNILCSNSAARKIQNLGKLQDYAYLQILPESKKTTQEGFKHLMALPNRNHIQKILESKMKEVLCKHFIPE